eukprot:3031435-Pyramimonas_sp.AAC.1
MARGLAAFCRQGDRTEHLARRQRAQGHPVLHQERGSHRLAFAHREPRHLCQPQPRLRCAS